ncbi:hypothetical protein Smp_154450, partial [Schistosoma mansoni]|uniref:hypothetical protein n=1 Tax=Schistosoma mansoni TaxID=6183 RepID=UPI00022C8356
INSPVVYHTNSLQILPLEVQSRITAYLKSDLQEHHLPRRAIHIVCEMKKSMKHDIKKGFIHLQGIWDTVLHFPISLIETHLLRLMNVQAKVDTVDPQHNPSSTENIPGSEADTCCLNVPNT